MTSAAMSMNRSSEDNNKKATMVYLSCNRRISEKLLEVCGLYIIAAFKSSSTLKRYLYQTNDSHLGRQEDLNIYSGPSHAIVTKITRKRSVSP